MIEFLKSKSFINTIVFINDWGGIRCWGGGVEYVKRLELSGPGTMLGDDHLFIVIVMAHALVITFFVMPILIGKEGGGGEVGNWFFPT